MPNDYDEWYEAIRESEDVSFEDLSDMSPEEIGRMTEDTGFSQKQAQKIAEQQEQRDIDTTNERNTVSTERQADLSEGAAYRPTDADETIVSIRGDKPDISADKIEGSYTYQGNKYVRVDGKVYGVVDE